MDYRKYAGSGREFPLPVSQGRRLHCPALGNAVINSPDLPKDYKHIYQRIFRIQGNFGGWYEAKSPANLLKS